MRYQTFLILKVKVYENLKIWAFSNRGHAFHMGDEEQKKLTTMLETYESHREQPVLWDTLSEELLEKQMKGIVGFKIIIDEVQAAFKLSQNRHERDYARIVEKLEAEGEVEIVEAMKERL